jgi:predicted lipoprotein with Yx(FWY)xxD motif
MARMFGLLAASVALLSLGAEAQQTAKEPAKLETAEKEQLGKYLTDAEGMSLYLFEADSKMTSNCHDDCAAAWPPLLTEGEPEAGEGVEASLVSTFERTDGGTQVAYDGWPLYYFVKDQSAGDTEGQDVEGFGAEWYLVSPDGGKVEAHE